MGLAEGEKQMKFGEELRALKLETKQDAAKAFRCVFEPLIPFYSDGKALLKLDNTGAHYDEKTACLEGFARVLFGLAPYLTFKQDESYLKTVIQGIKSGTNPESPEYWGKAKDNDQMFVEMAPISLSLILLEEQVKDFFDSEEKRRLYEWLNQINEHRIPKNNWIFFRIMVNLAFEILGMPYDRSRNDECFAELDGWYCEDGFYKDGDNSKIDYYNAYAIHFFSLIYYRYMKDKDSTRCDIIKNRARKFAKEYLYWFSSDGASVPYGRSLTYKFAASAFFGALVFADIEAVSWGDIKYTVFNNLRWWFRQSVFSRDNILTVGYSYSNLIMSEDYNSPTSSYWAMMWFILLAVDEKHYFWSAEEKAPHLAELHIQKQAGFLLARPENGRNVLLYSAGQSGLECYGGYRDKYSKFVYSGYFGFSVSRGFESLQAGQARAWSRSALRALSYLCRRSPRLQPASF